MQSPGNSVSIPSLSQSDDVQAVFQGCTPSNVSGKIRKRRVALPGRVITGEAIKARLSQRKKVPKQERGQPEPLSEFPNLDSIERDVEIITTACAKQTQPDEEVFI